MKPRTIAVSVALALAAPAAAGDYKIVVNPSNPVSALRRSEVSRIFLKQSVRFPDGRAAEPVVLAGGRAHARFCEEVHGKSPEAVRAFWNQQVFSGRNVPPVEKSQDRDVIAYVLSHPGGIGVVSGDAGDERVKVVEIGD